ncbi:ABC transporter ATP-binding protein [[Mycoplasma] collis]|uniref:ABC transporter ATP-binding protein n=1 Tax=[Mycoplasma] collis TaxID=2127 RepID=UPI00051C80BB|nr:ABC transporter ATP-binding protein [[Mycoplasma] collis]
MLKYFKKNFKSTFLIVLFSILNYMILTGISFLIADLVNDISNREKFKIYFIVIFLLIFFSIIFNLLSNLIKNNFITKVNMDISNNTLKNASIQNLSEIEENKGKYIYWISERRDEIVRYCFNWGIFAFEQITLSIFSIIISFVISWKIALFIVSFLIINFVISYFTTIKAGKMEEKFFNIYEKQNNSWIKNFDSFIFYWQIGIEKAFLKSMIF